MKEKDNKFKANIIGGFCVAIVGIIGALWLLINKEAILGAEFVALSLGFSVIGLIIAFAPEIQEFSIAGNGVKLKELRSEAEKTIEGLEQAKIEIFRMLLPAVINGSMQTDELVDPRVKNYLNLFNEIEKFKCLKDLKLEIERTLNILMVVQYRSLGFIHNIQKEIGDSFSKQDKPDFLYIKLDEKIISSYKSNQTPIVDFEVKKNEILDGIEAYAKLYAIKVKLDNLETDHA